MVCTSNDLSNWENFPKGLRVLLLDEDADSAAETKSRLESMEYIVSVFSNEDEALSVFSRKPESFHIAIVEVSENSKNEGFKFLEAAKDLPTVMTSDIQCLSTMMKCIALGAVEFLHKPLCDDKLRNIWQHVVHKAFSVGGKAMSESMKSGKDSIASMLRLLRTEGQNSGEKENVEAGEESGAHKYPAPSTPQLNQGARLLDHGDCHDNANCSPEKENGDQDVESKSVETTSVAEATVAHADPSDMKGDAVVKEEEDEADNLEIDNTGNQANKDDSRDSLVSENPSKVNEAKNTHVTKTNRKKVDWTPELHKKFVQAVEQLGVDQAIPSRILELMKVEGLTRHNVASHLQKYRMHRRNISPKEDERKWIQPKHQMLPGYYYPNRPVMAYPYHSHSANPARPVYHVWGVPGPGVHMWGPPSYPVWQPAESNWHWRPYAGVQSNAWGCPAMAQAHGSIHAPAQSITSGFPSSPAVENSFKMPYPNTLNFYPDEEVVDKVVKEAMGKPWLPLPLGLKPPSTESVLSELSKQGISGVSFCIKGSRLR